MEDSLRVHYLSTQGIEVIHPDILNHKNKIKQLQEELEYNLNADNIPTWVKSENSFDFWKKFINK
jgi:hypothetical protein